MNRLLRRELDGDGALGHELCRQREELGNTLRWEPPAGGSGLGREQWRGLVGLGGDWHVSSEGSDFFF